MNDAVLDLFAGPGGWSTGARALGLTETGIELDPWACATRRAAGHRTVQADVTATDPADYAEAEGLIASPPCRPWSPGGLREGHLDRELVATAIDDLAVGRDTRDINRAMCANPESLLAAEPIRWIRALRPAWVTMEQVPAVLPLWQQYAQHLTAWGYSVWTGVLNAADYGVPQTRKRAILIASRVRPVTAPEPTHAKNPVDDLFGARLQPWVTMAEALDALHQDGDWVLRSGQSIAGAGRAERCLDEPAVTITSRADLCAWVLKSRRDSDTWIASNGPRENRRGDQPAPTFTGEAHRWSWALERPATTVCSTNRIAPPGHRDRSAGGESHFASPDTIRVTVQEAAVLQSFRPDYPWQGSRTAQFLQVGNAIPPLLAAHIVSAATGIPMPATQPALNAA